MYISRKFLGRLCFVGSTTTDRDAYRLNKQIDALHDALSTRNAPLFHDRLAALGPRRIEALAARNAFLLTCTARWPAGFAAMAHLTTPEQRASLFEINRFEAVWRGIAAGNLGLVRSACQDVPPASLGLHFGTLRGQDALSDGLRRGADMARLLISRVIEPPLGEAGAPPRWQRQAREIAGQMACYLDNRRHA